jgi:phosphoinositide-3-kinase, regulatory subunit 4
MGNQTMVPTQIQSVESYFQDLKNYAQLKSSMGSTAFMKTAKACLIEDLSGLLDHHHQHHQLNITPNSNSAQIISSGQTNTIIVNNSNSNSNNNNNTNAILHNNNNNTINNNNNTSQQYRLNQMQLIKQRIQEMKEQQQQIVVKIFPIYDLSIRLKLYKDRVEEIKNIIYATYGLYTNCLPFSDMIITDRAAFICRQFIKYNLYDRLSTRPFLTHIEKKWIAFQLICAVNEIHSLQIVHGDMKTENVLVNSFLWVSLADFASYKPVYLSKNHPSADFNYYFDISRRRTCYLAPERLDGSRETLHKTNMSPNTTATNLLINDHENIDELVPPDPNDFQSSMDIFSLGCVLAELFMERPLFDFAHLLSYRDHKYDPHNELINEIRDKSILEMIFNMLSLDPTERKTANEYLQEQNDKSFPSYFVFLKNYIKSFISVRLTPDEIVIRLKNDMPLLLKNFKLNLNEQETTNVSHPSSQNTNINNNNNESNNSFTEIKLTNSQHDSSTDTNDAFLILLSLLLSCIRKIKFSENKLIAIDLLANFSKFLDDSVILDRILPYYTSLVEDSNQSPIVKSHVIYALNDCLSNIYNLDLQNMNIFPEIIFIILENLSRDESFLVRSAVAKTISNFALTSLRYLDTGFLIKRQMQNNNENNQAANEQKNSDYDLKSSRTAATTKLDKTNENKFVSYDKEFELYQTRITDIVMHLITDLSQTSLSSNAVKETLIRSDISKLCSFFSRTKTSEFLLPHMITILNEKTDWSVRAAFFDALCPVLSCIGWESVEIVKSLLEQGLRDSEEFVIHRTLITLSKMVEIGLLDRQQICYFLSNHITALLCHPSLWIRHGAVNFITVVCKQQQQDNNKNKFKKELTLSNTTGLSTRPLVSDEIITNQNNNNGLNTADVLCSVAPLLTKFLDHKDLINYDKEEILFHCLKKPIKRAVYDCISQDGRSDQLFFYLNQRSEIRCLTNQNYLPGYVDCSDPNVQEFFEKLCKLGFVEEDEDKLLHMKDFMDKTRISRLSSSLHNADMSLSNNSNNGGASVVLNNNVSWNNINTKENFIFKDGHITILKDRFQRFNCDLSSRKFPGLEMYSKLDTESKNFKLNSPSNQATQMKIDETTNTLVQATTTNENTLNNEWKIMFGESNSSSKQTLSRNKSGLKQSESNYQINRHHHHHHHHSINQYSFKNCTFELDKYLDKCKYSYEDHKVKRARLERSKETINSSISSNSVCLNSAGKWKPKGYLLVHSNEHTKEINKLSRNFDSTYFSTCSYSEASVKIWATDYLLDGKSGFFKSIFTYDKQTSVASARGQNQEGSSIRPCCTTFYDKNSLAILGEDFRFHVIDFNSNRTQYHLYTHEKLFKPTVCNCNRNIIASSSKNQFEKTTFYYLNRSYRNNQNARNNNNSLKSCSYCNSNYPIEMIYIDDSSPTWPVAATNPNDYFRTGSIGSSSKGLFCYSTSNGDFSCIDLRTRSKAFEIKRDMRKGYITSMVTDPWYTWIAMGTSYGNIELYDFRFMLPVQTFEHRSKTSVAKLCNHPSLSNRIVASYQGNNEISIWNMDVSQNVNSYKSSSQKNPEFVFWGVQSVPPLCQNKIASYYVSGMIGCSAGDENGLICASTDMKIRYIDLNDGNRESCVVSSPFNFQSGTKVNNEMNLRNNSSQNPNKIPQQQTSNNFEFANSLTSNNVTYELRQIEGNKVLLELDQYSSGQQFNLNNSSNTPQSFSYNSPALTHQSYFTHHQDAITDLVVCYNQYNSKNPPLIVTSARDGALKIWR